MAQFQLQHGPIPLHHQVYVDLRRALDVEEWAAGDRLPTERALAERYGCSLITVRHALGELAREGRIQRTRGRGTFVLPARIEHVFDGQMSFSEDMRRRGLDPETRLLDRRRELAGEAVGAALGIPVTAPVIYIERVRVAGGEPLLLEQARLPADRFAGLLEADLEQQSLYDVLGARYGAQVARTSETVEPIRVPTREARILEVRPGALALLVIGIATTRDDVPLEYTRSYVRTDRTRYRLDRVVHRLGWARTFEPEVVRPSATTEAAAEERPGRAAHR